LNGRAQVTLRTVPETARLYCADGRQMAPDWIQEDSALGLSVLGNMIPMNVSDWIAGIICTEYTRIQSDGLTAQQKWQKEATAATSSPDRKRVKLLPQAHETSEGRKRKSEVIITDSEDKAIKELMQAVTHTGKKQATYTAYRTHSSQWTALAKAKGWSPNLLDVENLRERARRIIYWLAWERHTYKVKASTLKTKISAVRWMHIVDLYPDPFRDLPAVTDWLANLKKLDGPTEQKLPVPIDLIKMIAVLIGENPTLHQQALKAAILSGFWYLMRSIEYLAEDDGVFDPDRSVTWGDITPRKAGKLLPFAQFAEADELTLTLYSSKNTLETCTRSLKAVPLSPICVVTALTDLFEQTCTHLKGRTPSLESPVFHTGTHCLRRKDISNVLKAAAVTAHIPKGRIASHSLRRGGASQMVAGDILDPGGESDKLVSHTNHHTCLPCRRNTSYSPLHSWGSRSCSSKIRTLDQRGLQGICVRTCRLPECTAPKVSASGTPQVRKKLEPAPLAHVRFNTVKEGLSRCSRKTMEKVSSYLLQVAKLTTCTQGPLSL